MENLTALGRRISTYGTKSNQDAGKKSGRCATKRRNEAGEAAARPWSGGGKKGRGTTPTPEPLTIKSAAPRPGGGQPHPERGRNHLRVQKDRNIKEVHKARLILGQHGFDSTTEKIRTGTEKGG